jgi:chromosome segregation protein
MNKVRAAFVAPRAAMRISKLNLYGFKSFPDRTVIQLGDGVSCVVGPNGCGKSNVLDAIKWCIGEQSAKSLRGSEMLDVIFAGSTERAPVGFAEVSLTLSAAGTPFPGEFADLGELEIGRRLHRTGTSEYFINRSKCRRKDILNLFMDTGVGSSLYSFIEQGRVESIVNASPLDRRSLIDEAAGITGYKTRRAEALQRLAATGAQLDRAADVADELGRRLRSVRTQVRRAARFRQFRGLIRQREIALALIKYAALTEDRRVLREASRGQERTMERLSLDEQQLQVEVHNREVELETVEASVSTWRDQLADLDGSLREMNAKDGFLNQQRTQATELQSRAEQELQALTVERDRASADLREALAGAEKDATARPLSVQELEAAEKELAEGQAQRQAMALRLEEVDAELQRLVAAFATAEAHTQQRRERLQAAPARREQLAQRLTEVDREVETLVVKFGELERSRALNGDRIAAIEADLEQAIARETASKTRLESSSARVIAQEAAAQGASTKKEAAVQALMEQLEGGLEAIESEIHTARRTGEQESDALKLEGQRRLQALRAEQATAHVEARRVLEATLQERAQPLGATQNRLKVAYEARRAEALASQESKTAALEAVHQEHLTAQEARMRAEHLDQRDRGLKEIAEREEWLAQQARVQEDRRADEAHLRGQVAAFTERLLRLEESLETLVPAQVEGHPSLYASEEWPKTEDWKYRALGERFFLPTFESVAAVLGARSQLEKGDGLAGILRRGSVQEQLIGSWQQANDLEAALQLHLETGGGVLVRGTGERIDADGVFRIGEHVDLAEQAIALREQLQGTQQELDEARDKLAQLERKQGETNQAIQEQSEGLAELRRALHEGAEGFHERLSAFLEEARVAHDARLALVRQEGTTALEALVEEYESAQEQARSEHERGLRDAREAGARALSELQESQLRAIDDLEESCALAVSAQRSEQTAALELLRARLRSEHEDQQAEHTENRRQAEEGLQRAVQGLETARAEQEEARATFEQALRSVAEQRALQSEQGLAAARVEEGLLAISRRRTELEERGAEARAEQAELADLSVDALEQEEKLLRTQEQALQAKRAIRTAIQEEIAAIGASVEAASARVQELAIVAGTLETRIAAFAGRKVQLEEQLAGCATRHQRCEADRQAASVLLAQLEAQGVALEAERKSVVAKRDEVWDRVEKARAQVAALKQGVGEARLALKTHRERVESMRAGVHTEQERLQAVQVDIEVIRRRISERYQISLAAQLDLLEAKGSYEISAGESARSEVVIGRDVVKAVEPIVLKPSHLEDVAFVETVLSELDEHRAQLERLGQVNLAAFDEYEELHKRHAQLEEQRADLEESVQRIRSAIAKMNRLCRQQFRDAFDAVNEHFIGAYPSLVGGGTARLSLTDEEDLLESGVDIFVQPPGKRLQNLGLLSGGEKAMAAIALLLALFRVKPSPFCVLDEVDAPLDEANGARFNLMLREMSRVSQFLVITHNRKTMECADALYGITMPKPGVSQIVAVELGGP